MVVPHLRKDWLKMTPIVYKLQTIDPSLGPFVVIHGIFEAFFWLLPLTKKLDMRHSFFVKFCFGAVVDAKIGNELSGRS